jgi:hypothetical protein
VARHLAVNIECVQGDGEGLGTDASVHTKVLSDANAASSCWITDTKSAVESADGRCDARGNSREYLSPMKQSFPHIVIYYVWQAMKGMNRSMNLPQIQKIMSDFERESATMDMREEMMSDAVDDVMDEGLEDEEEEGDKILRQVLDEIGVDLSQKLTDAPTSIAAANQLSERRAVAVADGAGGGGAPASGGDSSGGGGGGGAVSDEDALQARLDALRRG